MHNACMYILLSDVIHSSLEPIVGAGRPAETWTSVGAGRACKLVDRIPFVYHPTFLVVLGFVLRVHKQGS